MTLVRAPGRTVSHSSALLLARSVSTARMRTLDARAITDLGIPRLLLMDHAGLALAAHAARYARGPILICAGAGYNGGDGLSAARHLEAVGLRPRILLAARRRALRDEPAVFAAIAERLRLPIAELAAAPGRARRWLAEAALIIDALLGIGLQGVVRDPLAGLIQAINATRAPVLSADVPSGLDADTGEPLGTAVRARWTITFGRMKRGLRCAGASRYAGRVLVAPISFPRLVLEAG